MNENDTEFVQNSTIFDIWKYFDENSDELKEEEQKNLILIVSYSLIIIVSIVGNLLVCKVIFEKRSSLTTTNVMIGNLAISDLMMTVINIPFNIARFVLANWPFGQILCILVPFIQSVSVHSSSITMMFFAIERYKSLLHNTHLKCQCSERWFPFAGILVVIWSLSALFSIPHGIYNKVEPIYIWTDIIRCRVLYPEPKDLYNQRFTVLSLLTQYLIPIVLTFVCYFRISLFLWHREIIGNPSEGHRIWIMRRKKRRIKMLIIVVLIFAICWLPLNVYLLVTAYLPNVFSGNLFFICHWFAMSSVCYNPFIYCWLNENFRRRFKAVVTCCLITYQTTNAQNSINNILSRESNRCIETELADEGICQQECHFYSHQQNEETYV